jgi:hypothetical protein
MTMWWPVAVIKRSSVARDGSRRPDSYTLTTLCATLARSFGNIGLGALFRQRWDSYANADMA